MIRLSKPDLVARHLSTLLRRTVTLEPVTAAQLGQMTVSGYYVGARGELLGRCLADMTFAANAGAALSMVPADAARDCIKRRVLDETLRENFAEVLNVLCCLFTVEGGRVALKGTIFPPEKMPADVTPCTNTVSFEIEVDGYDGTGFLRVQGLA